MTGALTTLLFLGVSATLMGLFLILVRRVFGKRLPGVFYYLAWLVVLLRFVVPLPGLIPVGTAETLPDAIPAQTARPYGSARFTGAAGEDDNEFPRAYGSAETDANAADMGDRTAGADAADSPSAGGGTGAGEAGAAQTAPNAETPAPARCGWSRSLPLTSFWGR